MIMWDQRYATDTYLFGTEPNEFLVSHTQRIPCKGKVLCIGAGEGRNAIYLAKQGYKVTAVDASSVGAQKAKALAIHKGVSMK